VILGTRERRFGDARLGMGKICEEWIQLLGVLQKARISAAKAGGGPGACTPARVSQLGGVEGQPGRVGEEAVSS